MHQFQHTQQARHNICIGLLALKPKVQVGHAAEEQCHAVDKALGHVIYMYLPHPLIPSYSQERQTPQLNDIALRDSTNPWRWWQTTQRCVLELSILVNPSPDLVR